jgi:hypothetical protein
VTPTFAAGFGLSMDFAPIRAFQRKPGAPTVPLRAIAVDRYAHLKTLIER